MSDLVVPFDGFVYHPHQTEAVTWMTGRESEGAEHVRGGVLADEMGLGKTWMTMGLLLNSVVPNTLLLVPPVLQPQWAEALEKSGVPHRILSPPTAKNGGAVFRSVAGTRGFTVTLATYCRASRNVALLGEYDRIVCDEGHVLRNGPSTLTFRELDKIPALRRWILSGTPVQNRAADFRNLLRFLHMDIEAVIRAPLAKVAETVLMRRTVADVRDVVTTMPALKPAHEVVPVKMPAGGEEMTVFQALVGRLESAIDSHSSTMIILELYLRIRQFLAHPDIYVQAMRRKYKGRYTRLAWEGTASKMEAFREMLATKPAEPTIVFTTFKDEMNLAEAHLRRAGYETWTIGGGMSDAQRSAATTDSATAAAEGKSVAIIVQIVAGGAGLNLQHCSRVVFLSSHWNPAVVDQAIARAYRMGQTKPVTVVHFLVAEDAELNIDRRMAAIHGLKRTVAVGVHPKLFCDSAIRDGVVATSLDAVLDKVVAEEPLAEDTEA